MTIIFVATALLLLVPPSDADHDGHYHGLTPPTEEDVAWSWWSSGLAEMHLERRVAKARRPDEIRGAVADLVRGVREEERAAANANLAVLSEHLFHAIPPQDGFGIGNDPFASGEKLGKFEDCGWGYWKIVNAARQSDLRDCQARGCSVMVSSEWNALTNCKEVFMYCPCIGEESGPAEEDSEYPSE